MSTWSGGWAPPAGGRATSPPPPWVTSTGYGCASGSAGGRTTGPPRPRSNCAIPARSARSTRPRGPRRRGWPRRSAARTRAPWSPGPAPPCSPVAWPRPPARAGPARPARPRGGWRSGRRPAGRSRRPGRWAARSRGPGGRWHCRPRSRCGGCACRWPCWSSRRRCWTGWIAGRRSIRRDTWPPGCSTTPGTASESGRDAGNAGPFGPYCLCCAAVTWPAGRYLGRPRLNSAGTMMSSGDSSPIEDRPSASSVESMPPRRTSKTFFTPAAPFAARPHR